MLRPRQGRVIDWSSVLWIGSLIRYVWVLGIESLEWLQELAKLLQEPMQPRYSQRYFAGAPSAALAGKVQSDNDGEEEGGQQDHASEAISQVGSLNGKASVARQACPEACTWKGLIQGKQH